MTMTKTVTIQVHVDPLAAEILRTEVAVMEAAVAALRGAVIRGVMAGTQVTNRTREGTQVTARAAALALQEMEMAEAAAAEAEAAVMATMTSTELSRTTVITSGSRRTPSQR